MDKLVGIRAAKALIDALPGGAGSASCAHRGDPELAAVNDSYYCRVRRPGNRAAAPGGAR